MTKKLPGLFFALAVSVLAGAANAPAVQAHPKSAEAAASREYRIKAAFLYQFAKFTVWPAEAFADATAPLRLCVLGHDPFHGALATLEGRTVNNRAIVGSRLAGLEDIGKCHLLFVGASKGDRLGTILKSLRGMPVLLVGDTPEFAESGGIVRLKIVESKVRFEINVGAARQAKLKLDPRLLKLGKIIGNAVVSSPNRAAPTGEPSETAAIGAGGGAPTEDR